MDVKQEVTNRIIEVLERGTQDLNQILVRGSAGGMPRNGATGAEYRGSNILCLWIAQMCKGYSSNVWLTYKQAQAMGAQVRKGEEATLCAYFDKKQINVEAAEGQPEEGDEGKRFYAYCKPFYLFNVEQIDNLPEHLNPSDKVNASIAPIEDIEAFISKTGAQFSVDGFKMCYSPTNDVISLPAIEHFTSVENYYNVKLHELSHWTGHESRLNRTYGKRFGDRAYACEELTAEICGAVLAGRFGIFDATLENHASYIESWIECLKADKNAVFTMSKAAFEAYDFLVGLQAEARLAA